MKGDTVFIAVVVIILILLIGACERAKWRECRRYHPRWYCFNQLSDK